MDVNITFLNGNLNETIYMMEPNVIIAKKPRAYDMQVA